MTEQEEDQMYEVKALIWTAVDAVVDAATGTLTREQDEELRQELTEQYRFWRPQ